MDQTKPRVYAIQTDIVVTTAFTEKDEKLSTQHILSINERITKALEPFVHEVESVKSHIKGWENLPTGELNQEQRLNALDLALENFFCGSESQIDQTIASSAQTSPVHRYFMLVQESSGNYYFQTIASRDTIVTAIHIVENDDLHPARVVDVVDLDTGKPIAFSRIIQIAPELT